MRGSKQLRWDGVWSNVTTATAKGQFLECIAQSFKNGITSTSFRMGICSARGNFCQARTSYTFSVAIE